MVAGSNLYTGQWDGEKGLKNAMIMVSRGRGLRECARWHGTERFKGIIGLEWGLCAVHDKGSYSGSVSECIVEKGKEWEGV